MYHYTKSAFLQMTTNFELVLSKYSKHSNLDFAHYLVIQWLLQNGTNKNQDQESYQRKIFYDKLVIFEN